MMLCTCNANCNESIKTLSDEVDLMRERIKFLEIIRKAAIARSEMWTIETYNHLANALQAYDMMFTEGKIERKGDSNASN